MDEDDNGKFRLERVIELGFSPNFVLPCFVLLPGNDKRELTSTHMKVISTHSLLYICRVSLKSSFVH